MTELAKNCFRLHAAEFIRINENCGIVAIEIS